MYIITSKTRAKIMRSSGDRQKLVNEREQRAKELGCRGFQPLKGQDEMTALNDLRNSESVLKEKMAAAQEQQLTAIQERQRSKTPTSLNEAAGKYFKLEEQKEKHAAAERKIVV